MPSGVWLVEAKKYLTFVYKSSIITIKKTVEKDRENKKLREEMVATRKERQVEKTSLAAKAGKDYSRGGRLWS